MRDITWKLPVGEVGIPFFFWYISTSLDGRGGVVLRAHGVGVKETKRKHDMGVSNEARQCVLSPPTYLPTYLRT